MHFIGLAGLPGVITPTRIPLFDDLQNVNV
jgi:hypothetical protein